MNQNIIFILLLFTHINIIFALYGQYIQVTDIQFFFLYLILNLVMTVTISLAQIHYNIAIVA